MTRLSILVVACLTLVGCNTLGERILTDQKCNNPNQCSIEIKSPTCGITGCSATVVDRVILERGKNNFKVTWTLPAGFAFCDTAGDGVWLKKVDPYGQFEDPRWDKPSGTGLCKFREFQLKAKNTRSLPHEPFFYKIYFHDEAGTQLYVIDPAMINE